MANSSYTVETITPFAESLIWQLNRAYYQKKGIEAWRSGVVPHHLSSNAMIGKTYAELIVAFLKDLASKGAIHEKVYIMELGAGHGRFAFHILKHLDQLLQRTNTTLPDYCYILSDIALDNLTFFEQHPQFQPYFEQGHLDVAYYDAINSQEIVLRYAQQTIVPKQLNQPLLLIANYFFDSIPNDLFILRNQQMSPCSVSLSISEDPKEMEEADLLEKLYLSYYSLPMTYPFYEEPVLNEILQEYQKKLVNTHLLFPHKSLQCLHQLQQFSTKGMLLLSMDKGYHQLEHLESQPQPDMVVHGSMSFWVNYHAYGAYCEKQGGMALFPSFSTFDLELACLLFLPDSDTYTETKAVYQRVINDFGPDDFNGLKKMTYRSIATITLVELIGFLRLSAYDSTLFINVLPRIKQVAQQVTVKERPRLAQTLHQVWDMYFTINEPFDLAFEIGGLLYGLGYYKQALRYFQYSVDLFGQKADIFYNQSLCYYHLRQDQLFLETLQAGKALFPDFEHFTHLDSLDLTAA